MKQKIFGTYDLVDIRVASFVTDGNFLYIKDKI